MPFQNYHDDSSTTVSADTPGRTLDLRQWKTRARAGVPVKFWVKALTATPGDTGAVLLVDETGAAVLTVLIDNGPGWYNTTGILPATRAKYDVHYGGNTVGILAIKDWSLYPLADVGPNEGVLAKSIGAVTLVAEGTAPVSGELTQSIGDIALAAVAELERLGELQASIGDVTLSAAATKSPVWIANGNVTTGTGSIAPPWPTHEVNDIALLIVETANEAVTLSDAQGFVEVTNSPQGTGTAGGTSATRLTVFWCRASSTSMTAPTIADPGDHCIGRILTFRHCRTTGDPWDIIVGDVQAGADNSVEIPGGTTTVDNCLVVAICAIQIDNITGQFGTFSNADLTNVAGRLNQGAIDGNGGGLGVATGKRDTAGTFGTTTCTLTGASSVQARMMIALRP
jgi:hypothetical protein